MKKNIYRILTCAILPIIFTNCSEEKNEELELETVSESSQSATCDSCSQAPGDSADFRSALQKMDLEHNTNNGSSKFTENRPENDSACDKDYFTRCNSWMVLRNENKNSDRTELKLQSTLSLNNYAKMEFRAVLENIPTTDDSSSRGITIGQIHNRYKDTDGPLVKVYVTKHTNKMRVVVNDDYSDASTKHTDLVDYNEGDEFLLRLEILSSRDQVKVYARNYRTNEQETITIDVDKNWDKADGNYYFKTGLYNQATGKNSRMSYRYLSLDSI